MPPSTRVTIRCPSLPIVAHHAKIPVGSASTMELAEAAGIQKQRSEGPSQAGPYVGENKCPPSQPPALPAPSALVPASTYLISPRSTTSSAGRIIPPPTAPASKAIV